MQKTNKLFRIIDTTLIILICILSYEHIKNFKTKCHNSIHEARRELIENFSQQISHNVLLNDFNIKNKLDLLKKNVSDKNSIELIDTVMKNAVKTLQHDTSLLYTEFQKKHFINFSKEFNLKSKTIEEYFFYLPAESAYFHHGLKFANDKIKNYVQNKDILDIGAYDGDSFLILKNYTNKNVYCFEFSPKNIAKFYENMKKHSVFKGFTLIQKGVSDTKKIITIFDDGGGGVSIHSKTGNDPVQVELTTLDEEAKNYNMRIGFIKADVEGHGFHVVKGAINTIKRDRPVLSLSIYHNIEEFFEIKPFLEKHLNNYVYEFQSENFHSIMSELTLFCYPKEIMK